SHQQVRYFNNGPFGPRFQSSSGGFGNKRRFQNSQPFYTDRRNQAFAAVFVAGSGMYYVTHLEVVPISGRRRFMDVTPAMETAMSQQAYAEVMREYAGRFLPSYHPTVLTVKKVARRIIQAAGIDETGWEFHVIDSKEMNAFVLPGGKVFVFTGILPVCQNENGLAAILGHEIAHQVARHSAEKCHLPRFSCLYLQILVTAALDTSASFSRIITELGVMLPFSRKMARSTFLPHENEADSIGLLLMAQACYDPRETVALWQRMEQASKGGPPEFMSTHPAHSSRITKIEQQLPAALDRLNASDCQHASGFLVDMFRSMPMIRW
ncbi:mitochondrial metalloendopeptidase OMA1, partial [Catenaria anguillulae PL171]